jgi:hypothetical protein
MVTRGTGPGLGISFVFERWKELVDPEARWWSRGTGLGLLLRLQELLELSEARRGGLIYSSPVEQLRKQAADRLSQTKSFIAEHYGPLRELLSEALSTTSRGPEASGLGSLWPQSGPHGAIEAGLAFLRNASYLQAITAELANQAESASDVDQLRSLDELVEHLDAELIGDGHSRRWRAEFYSAVETEVRAGEAFGASLTKQVTLKRQRRTFQVVAAITASSEPSQIEVPLSSFSEEELFNLIETWEAEVPEEVLAFPSGGLLQDVEAADAFAAAELAGEEFGKRSAVWNLQGGEVELELQQLIAYDGTGKRVDIVSVDQPLNVRPDNLEGMRIPGSNPSTPEKLTDGLLQLAQARRSPSGAALADLWGVAEVCFSGVAVGSRDQAGSVIAGIAEFLYLRDCLDALAERFAAAGAQPAMEAGQDEAEWALDLIANHGPALFKRLKKRDALAWARAKQIARWDDDRFLYSDLASVRERVESACARAYLIRNFYIHAGQSARSGAIAVTLPIFAELLRISLGFALGSNPDKPIVSARLATLRARQLAFDYKERDVSGPEALAETIGLERRPPTD